MQLETWAVRWGVSHEALQDLRVNLLLLDYAGGAAMPGKSEASVQSRVRLEAVSKGVRLWRNNKGVLPDSRGVPVRFGLANDSPAVDKVLKSADLVGIRTVEILPKHVGLHRGQFVSREIKEEGWRYTGTPREVAQLNWANLVNAMGGDAAFATGVGTL